MRTRIFAGSGLAILVVIVVAAVIASNPLSSEAATGDESVAMESPGDAPPRADVISADRVSKPNSMGELQATPDSDTESKPYIGIVVSSLEDGSVKVVRVLEDGPSDGVLETGDIVTAVAGEAVDSVNDLTDGIAEAGIGETLTLTITRDGSEMDVSVTIGEWTKKTYRMGRVFHKAKRSQDRISSRQVVKADDDGNYRTYRTVYGNVTALDADAGTFTLRPKDGSDAISYSINDDTRIYVGKGSVDDLSSLDMDEQTVVMDVDGEVKLVKQGEDGDASGFRHRKEWPQRFGPGFRVYIKSSS